VEKSEYERILRGLFGETTAAVLVSSGVKVPAPMRHAADQAKIPLLGSSRPSNRLIDHIDHYLRETLAERKVVHGVMLDVMGLGVLLTGVSAIGKSELALELITRGHKLIADDAPEFVRLDPDTLRGSCPRVLQDFLEVRGLGLLNIRAMFGDNAIKQSKNLRLKIHLVPEEQMRNMEGKRLTGVRHRRTILEVEVPEIELPVAPGRNLAVLVEAAVRNHLLLYHGYDSAAEFTQRQQRLLS